MKYGDIDIDLGDRDRILKIINYSAASIRDANGSRKHSTGIHITNIPYDPIKNTSSLDHTQAENRGYMKIDLLNVNVYSEITDELHLIEMMADPDWSRLNDKSFVENIIHINKHYDTIRRMPEPINSIQRMAMMLAVIRPGKRHLIGKPWKEVSETIWEPSEEGYVFRKSHAVAYSHLVVVAMNLHCEKLKISSSPE